MANPLVADYIRKDSRGKAIALVATGMGVGETFSMTVLFGLSSNLPLNQSYQLASVILIAMTFASVFMLKEPELKTNIGNSNSGDSRDASSDLEQKSLVSFEDTVNCEDIDDMSFWSKVSYLTGRVH